MSHTGVSVHQLAVTADPQGRPLVAWQDSANGPSQILVRGNLSGAASRTLVANATTTVQQIIDQNVLQPGDLVIVTGATTRLHGERR